MWSKKEILIAGNIHWKKLKVYKFIDMEHIFSTSNQKNVGLYKTNLQRLTGTQTEVVANYKGEIIIYLLIWTRSIRCGVLLLPEQAKA